jgi:hypothetical protein
MFPGSNIPGDIPDVIRIKKGSTGQPPLQKAQNCGFTNAWRATQQYQIRHS